MSYKVTISGAVLEKCIEHITFYVDTPDHYDMQTDPKNSMIITGKIDTDEGTALLYKWAVLPATNPDCYKEISVEYTKDNQLVRKVSFSKAFVVDYSESYSNYSGVGTFTLYIRQFRGKDIECIGQTSRPSTEASSVVEEVEKEIDVVKKQIPIATIAPVSKSTMSITDRIAKRKEMMDNGNIGNTKILVNKGEQFTNGRKNKLKPNIRYKTGEYDYFYETDNAGRITKFETEKLQLTKRTDRLSHSKNTPGKIKGKDDAGHLAGDRFGGSPKIDNLVSQLSDVNQKQYKKIENKWAAALNEKPPKTVTVDLDVAYSGKDMRPEKFIVKYTIDGKPGSAVFKN
jgi:antitoxin (DNA-binding transcriptional repressor) of toxin-antitoxin stability system